MVHTVDISIIPILSAQDLPLCLSNLRRQCNEDTPTNIHSGALKRELLSHCVSGRPLLERQTNILTDISSDFKDLTGSLFVPDRMGRLCDLLGEKDAGRLVSHMTDGPTPARD